MFEFNIILFINNIPYQRSYSPNLYDKQIGNYVSKNGETVIYYLNTNQKK